MSEMPQKSNVILLPEAGQPVIDAVGSHNATGYQVQVEAMPLLGDEGHPGALDKLKNGEYAAVVVGADTSSAEVIKAGLEVIGAEDGLISSFFAMEGKEGAGPENRIFLADCAVVPNPSSETLVKIAEQTCTNVEKLGIKPLIAFITAAEGVDDETSVVDEADIVFGAQNPGRTSIGTVRWDEAKDESLYEARTGKKFPEGETPNVFVFPELSTGNIVYKVLQDPEGTGWTSQETRPSSYVLEKDGRRIVLSNTQEKQPNADQLVKLAEEACEGVTDPVVAFLSFSTEGSSTHAFASEVGLATGKFRELHPDLPVLGEIQWDSATNESIYTHKTKGKGYPDGKTPNVFIFPNQDSADIVYRILQEPANGGLTAVGPMLQGFKNGILLIDLSRGVDEKGVTAVVKLTGQLAGLDAKDKAGV